MFQLRNNSTAAFLAKNDLLGGPLPVSGPSIFAKHGPDGGSGNTQQITNSSMRAPSPSTSSLFYSQPMQPHAPPVITSQIDSAVQELCKALPFKPKELTSVVELIKNRDQQLSAVVLPPGQRPQYFGEHLSSMPRAQVQFVIEGTRITGQVPWLLNQCVETLSVRLNVVGLFRVAGNQQRQKMLKEAITKFGPTVVHSNLLSNSIDAIDIAAILKSFFSSIPGSVLTAELQEYFWQALASSELTNEAKSRCIALLTFLLPAINRDTLLYYMQFLHNVGLNSNANRMDHASLAVCCTSVFPIPPTVKQTDLTYQQGVRQSLLQAFIQRPGILLLGSGVVRPSSALSTSTANSLSAFGKSASVTPGGGQAAPARFKFASFVLGRKTPGSDFDGAMTEQQNGSKDVTDAAAETVAVLGAPQAELFPSVKLGEQVFTFDSSPNISPRKHQSIDRHRIEPKLMRSAGRMWTPGGTKRLTPGAKDHMNIRRRNSKSGSGLFSRFRTSPLIKRDSLKGSGGASRTNKKPSLKLTAASATRVRNSCREQQQVQNAALSKSSRKVSGSKSSLTTTSTVSSSSNSDLGSTITDDNISDDVELDVDSSGDDAAQQRLDFAAPTPTPTSMKSDNQYTPNIHIVTPTTSAVAQTLPSNFYAPGSANNLLMPQSSTEEEPQSTRYMGSLRNMVSLVKRRSQILFGSKTNLNAESSTPLPVADYHNAPAPIKTFGTNSSSTTVVKEITNDYRHYSNNGQAPRLVRATTSVNSGSRPKIISLTQHDGTLGSPAHRSTMHSNGAVQHFSSNANSQGHQAESPFKSMTNVAQHNNFNTDDDADMSMSSID